MSDMLVHNVYRDGQWVAEIERRGETHVEYLQNLALATARAAQEPRRGASPTQND
jgi:hypothetical protein